MRWYSSVAGCLTRILWRIIRRWRSAIWVPTRWLMPRRPRSAGKWRLLMVAGRNVLTPAAAVTTSVCSVYLVDLGIEVDFVTVCLWVCLSVIYRLRGKGTNMVLSTPGPLLISSFQGRQSTGGVNHKPSSRMLLPPARPTVTCQASKRHCPWQAWLVLYIAWCVGGELMWTTFPGSLYVCLTWLLLANEIYH